MFGRMKDPVDGTATLIGYSENHEQKGSEVVLSAQFIVEADGMASTTVDAKPEVPQSWMPVKTGTVWPVQVDRANPTRLKSMPAAAAQLCACASAASRSVCVAPAGMFGAHTGSSLFPTTVSGAVPLDSAEKLDPPVSAALAGRLESRAIRGPRDRPALPAPPAPAPCF